MMPRYKIEFLAKDRLPDDPNWKEVTYEIDSSTQEEAVAEAMKRWEEDRPGESDWPHNIKIQGGTQI